MEGNKGNRISALARRARVLPLKFSGLSDRKIAELLANDPINPVKVSHKTINLDWHAGLAEFVAAEEESARVLRALAHQQYKEILSAHWPLAVGIATSADKEIIPPEPRSAEVCMKALEAVRKMYGLDRELGDEDRPINVQERTPIDYSKLGTDEIKFLIRIIQRQQGIIDG